MRLGSTDCHAELIDAVNDGRVRRKSDPDPPQRGYDSGDWNEHRWQPLVGVSFSDRSGNWTHSPGGDGKPAFTKEEYSAADIEQLADEELSRRARRNSNGQKNGGEEQAGTANDQSADGSPSRGFIDGDAKLVEEMYQLITSGRVRNRWDAALALAPKAEGHGNLDSKARRLAKLYRVLKR